MAKKNAIVDTFNADEATVDTLLVAELVKKGKYRVFNGTGYDTVYLQTSAEQVIESETQKFVSQTEKNTWNNKADKGHHHDDVYAKKEDYNTKAEITNLLSSKSDVGHTHDASTIKQEPGYKFVSDAEKLKWNDACTSIEQIGTTVTEINSSVESLRTENNTAHSDIIREYKAAVSDVDSKVTTIKEQVTSLTENKANKTDVTTDINKAKQALEAIINTKADKVEVNNNLKLKADADKVYSKEVIDDKLSSKVETSDLTTELTKKVDKTAFNSALAAKADDAATKAALNEKASSQDLEAGLLQKANKDHNHIPSQITGLGTAATKDTGTKQGNIPVLNEKGQLETSVLPPIAINKKFDANTASEAMDIEMEIGDILILTSAAREDVMKKQTEGKSITYKVAKSKMYQELSDEYITYISSGKITYLCVDDEAKTFEEKFKPLQSSGDTITSAEVESKLASKVSINEFRDYKNEVTENLGLKADASNTYTINQVDTSLSKKVDKEHGKQLSTHDFTDALKTKLERIPDEVNNYVHPTEDGDLHVPATGSNSNGMVLVAGSSPKTFSWKKLTTANISESTDKKYVTDEQIAEWTAKANSDHKHAEYRLASESFTQSETRTEISKMRTIVSTEQPSIHSQMVGAVWIEEITN